MTTALILCGCIPWIDGNRVRHSRECPDHSDEVLTSKELSLWREANRQEMLAAVKRHPAGGTVTLRSVNDPGYVDAHLDDADDDGPHGFDRDWVGE